MPNFTPHLPLGPVLQESIINSVEAYLNTNVVTPYNTAVASTNYATPCSIKMDSPDDYDITSMVPVIILNYPIDVKPAQSTGAADGLVWSFMEFNIKVYPGLSTDPNTSVMKPVLHSASYLRSLFTSISTSLLLPLYDYSQNPAVQVDVAFITKGFIRETHGAVKNALALEKHRFDYVLGLRFPLPALNG